MKPKSHYLTSAQLGILYNLEDWEIWDIPSQHWDKLPHFQRKQDTLAVMASGCFSEPKEMNGILSSVGFDLVAHEPKPKRGEGDINLYHFLIEDRGFEANKDKQFLMTGPYNHSALLEHWPTNQEALDFYSSVGTLWQPPTSTCSESSGFPQYTSEPNVSFPEHI